MSEYYAEWMQNGRARSVSAQEGTLRKETALRVDAPVALARFDTCVRPEDLDTPWRNDQAKSRSPA